MLGGVSVDKNKISIKINGRERTFAEKPTKEEPDHASHEIAATTETNSNDEFHWVLPQAENGEEKRDSKIVSIEDLRSLKTDQTEKKHGSFVPKNLSNSISKQLILVILLAIIIGIGFGMFILNIVSKDITHQESGTGPVTGILENPQPNKMPNVKGGVPFQFQGFELYVVQAGAFSTLDKAKAFAESILPNGIPAAYMKKDQYFLLIGAGLNEEIVKSVGNYYKNLGIETYSKPYSLEGKTITVTNKAMSEQLPAVKVLLEQLLTATTAVLSGASISDNKWSDLEATYKTINFSIFQDDDHVKTYTNEIDAAYQSFTSYHKNQNIVQLYQSQQALLNAIRAYEVL